VAPDHVMCSPEIRDKFVEEVKKVVNEFYKGDVKKSPDYARMINQRNFDRVSGLIDMKKVVMGGDTDKSDLFISPTVMTGVTYDDAVMQDEIFGPIMPIIDVADADEAVQKIKKGEKPLALYCFTNNATTREKFLQGTSSGGCCVNDVIAHAFCETLPFGGVGNSGMGAYHGWYSYDCFSHKKSVMVRTLRKDDPMIIRFPPHTNQQ